MREVSPGGAAETFAIFAFGIWLSSNDAPANHFGSVAQYGFGAAKLGLFARVLWPCGVRVSFHKLFLCCLSSISAWLSLNASFCTLQRCPIASEIDLGSRW